MAAKKKAVKKKNTNTISGSVGSVTAHLARKIEKLDVDYGREDLNQMAAKINELVEKSNA